MKKFSVFSVMLVFLLALGMAFVSCDDGSNNGNSGSSGTLILTDIPAEYNGRYVNFQGISRAKGREIWGAESIDAEFRITAMPQIRNGRVEIKLWVAAGVTGNTIVRYDADETVTSYNCLIVSDTSNTVVRINFPDGIIFSNGNSTKSITGDNAIISSW